MRLLFLFALTIVLISCTSAADPVSQSAASSPTANPTLTEPVVESPTDTAIEPATPSAEPTKTVTVAETVTIVEPDPTLQATDTPLDSVETARRQTARELVEVIPPLRDDVGLAIAYRGASPVLATPAPTSDPQLGDTDTFFIGNVDSNTNSTIDAVLMSVGESAYFWFDTGGGAVEPSQDDLQEVTTAYDEIYDVLSRYFSMEQPEEDKIHIVHASPSALCDDSGNCRLAGYFSSQDLLPRSINPYSNERSMFVMNTLQFGSGIYLDVLAHETRHLLGNEFEAGEEDWFVEGGAMLAEDLAGFSSIGQARGTLFLEKPDQQLNSWTDENTIPYYGQGYLINRYIYDRLGEDLYREFIFSEKAGLSAVDDVANANGLDTTGDEMWLDWLVAMAVMDARDVASEYRWRGPELGPPATTQINNLPARLETTVSQYAADYYELPSSGTTTIDFAGTPLVPLLPAGARSGDFVWYAQRANDSNPRLTRALDLRDVQTATLTYDVFSDIEYGYDFGYVSVSEDGGRTWQGLEASGMQGLNPQDDPSDKALTDRFYTGRNENWTKVAIDLSPFAGKEILLRFEYVTDPIMTFGGFAFDDIEIAETGFFDDAESLADGWTAEGFTRATMELPQTWWLQVITFDDDGRPTIERIAVPEDGDYQLTLSSIAGQRRPILVVAAVAPETLQAAGYTIDISSR